MPATKARVFCVEIRDGNGVRERFIPAPSKASLENDLQIHSNEKLMDIKHLKHHPVEARPNEDTNTVEFILNVNGKKTVVAEGDLGHKYLVQQFPEQVKNVEKFLCDESEC